MNRSRISYDFCIFTPLTEEMDAAIHALKAFSDGYLKEIKSEPFPVYECKISCGKERELHGLIVSTGDAGQTLASSAATYILNFYRFKIFLLVGICGGFRNGSSKGKYEIRLGDVIFSSSVIDGDIRKYALGGHEIKQEPFFIQRQYVDVFRSIINEMKSHRSQKFPLLDKVWSGLSDVGFHEGSMLSVGSVIADSGLKSDLIMNMAGPNRVQPPLGVEMEAIGVLTASKYFGSRYNFAMIRSVNDFADENKNLSEVGIRKQACENSAYISIEFIKRVLCP